MDFKVLKERLKGLPAATKWLDPFTYVDLYVMPRVNPSNSQVVAWAVYLVFAFLFAFILYTGLGLLLGTASPMVIVVSGSMEPFFYRGDVILLVGASPDQIRVQEITLKRTTLDKIRSRDYVESHCFGEPFRELLPCDSYLALLAQRKISDTDFAVKELRFADGQTLRLDKEGDVLVYFSEALQQPIIHRAVAKLKAGDGVYFLTKGDSVHNPLIDQETHIIQSALPAREVQGKMVFKIPLLGYVKLLLFDVPRNLLTGCYFSGKCPFP